MTYSQLIKGTLMLILPLLLALVVGLSAAACGDDATPVVIEKEVIVEAPGNGTVGTKELSSGPIRERKRVGPEHLIGLA